MARHIVAPTSDIPPGGNKVVTLQGREVVVFHANGELKGPYVSETFPVHVEDNYVIVET